MTDSSQNSRPLRMLLVGSLDPSGDLRATFLREHGLEVDVAASIAEAQALWNPNAYLWVLVDVRKHLPGEVADFCSQIRDACPQQQIAFLVGPPRYITLTWPGNPSRKTEESPQGQAAGERVSEAA